MAEKRTIELEIQDNSKSLKAQYKEAVQELQKVSQQYGETSKEAVKAAKAAAELKDQIGFSKDLVSSFNPDAKFDSLTKSIGGALNGFQAYEGAMGLIGVQNEELQATMLKVQSAMALSQGIQGVFEAKDAFVQLGTVLKSTAIGQGLLTIATAAYNFVLNASTTGLKLFRVALISTGIGALVVGVGLLVANFDAIVGVVKKVVGWFGGLSGTVKNILSVMFPFIGVIRLVIAGLEAMGIIDNEQEKIKKANHEKDMKRTDAALKKQEEMRKAREKNFTNEQNNYDRAIKLAQAEGKSVYELTKAKIISSIKNQEAKYREIDAELKYMRVLAEQAKFIDAISGGALSARVDELDKLLDASSNEIENQKNDLKILEIEKNKPAAGTGGTSGGGGTNQAKEQLDITRKLKDDELRILEDGFDKEMSLLNEKRKREKEDAEKQFKEGVLKKEDYNKLIASIDTTYEADRKKIYEKDTADQIKARDYNIENLVASKIKEGDIEMEASAKKIEIAKDEAEKRKEIERDVTNAKIQMAKDGLQLVSNVTELFGRKNEKNAKIAFQVDKAAKVASAGIAGVEGTINAYKTAQGSPYTAIFPGYPIVQAGLAAAFAATNIAKIAQAKFGGSTSQSGGGGGGGGGGVATMTPQFNTVGNNGINQLAQLQQQPTQAYVVSGQVTSQQALDRNRQQNSSL
jgi:hypothetical protein